MERYNNTFGKASHTLLALFPKCYSSVCWDFWQVINSVNAHSVIFAFQGLCSAALFNPIYTGEGILSASTLNLTNLFQCLSPETSGLVKKYVWKKFDM